MFSMERNLKFFATYKVLLMDGTFDSSSSLFQQVFILHGMKQDTYIPLAYFLAWSADDNSLSTSD